MELLKVIARLLDYPNQETASHLGELSLVISQATQISPDCRARLLTAAQGIYAGELLDAEERYTGLFEQGRSLSLHLFEHVHGESRDRGQAMVDLMAEYAKHGFEMDAHELPDYIPLFLEYLSYSSDIDARVWLADVSHILALLGARLHERASPYAELFEVLLQLAGRSSEMQAARGAIASEEPDNTPEALDKEWEEVAVSFSATEQSCNSENSRPDSLASTEQALRWVDASQTPPQTNKHFASGGQPS